MLHIKLSHTVRPNFSIVLQDKDDPNTQYKILWAGEHMARL